MDEFIGALANRAERLEKVIKDLKDLKDLKKNEVSMNKEEQTEVGEAVVKDMLQLFVDKVRTIEQFTDRIVALEHKLSDIEGYIIKPMKDKIYSLERKVSDMEDYLRQSDYE